MFNRLVLSFKKKFCQISKQDRTKSKKEYYFNEIKNNRQNWQNFLLKYCGRCDSDMIRWALDNGASPLHAIAYSSSAGHVEMVREVLAGSGPLAKDFLNHALLCACSSGNIQIAELLNEKGADNFEACLLRTFSVNNLSIVNYLEKKGVNSTNLNLYLAEIPKFIIMHHSANFLNFIDVSTLGIDSLTTEVLFRRKCVGNFLMTILDQDCVHILISYVNERNNAG